MVPAGRIESNPMQPFKNHVGKIVVLPQADVDTDQIIPARFLSMVTRSGYGEQLFVDLRNPEFPLDKPEAKGATVLVTEENFGCGSSREHAVWAIQQAGFKAIIAKKTERAAGYSDIFRQNAANNGLLLIELNESDHDVIAQCGSGTSISIDLETQTVSIGSRTISFEISPSNKHALLKGLDLIGTTLVHEAEISRFEAEKGPFTPKLSE